MENKRGQDNQPTNLEVGSQTRGGDVDDGGVVYDKHTKPTQKLNFPSAFSTCILSGPTKLQNFRSGDGYRGIDGDGGGYSGTMAIGDGAGYCSVDGGGGGMAMTIKCQ